MIQAPHDRSHPSHFCKLNGSQPETLCSAIGQYLLQNQSCVHKCTECKFSIFDQGGITFHLFTLEAIYVKTSCPDLYKQKNSSAASNSHIRSLLSIGHFFDQSFASALLFAFLRFRYKSSYTANLLYSDVFSSKSQTKSQRKNVLRPE